MRRLFKYHPRWGYQFIPSLKARVPHEAGGYLVQTNAAGFRCKHEFVNARTSNLKRILLFGDSFTAGDGVRNEERYGDVLEQRLPSLEVYNFGLSGSGSDQQLLIARDQEPIARDLVVVAVLVENIRRVISRYRPFLDEEGGEVVYAKPYFELAHDGGLELCGVPVPDAPIPVASLPESERDFIDEGGGLTLLRQVVNRMGPIVKSLAQRVTRYQPVPQYDSANDPAWRLMKSILQTFITESKTPVVFFPIPLYQHVEETASAEGYQARFAELADGSRSHVIDPLPALLRYSPSERRAFRFKDDVHPTPAAHRALAEALAAGLTQKGLI